MKLPPTSEIASLPIPAIRRLLADLGLPSDLATAGNVRQAARRGDLQVTRKGELVFMKEGRLIKLEKSQ